MAGGKVYCCGPAPALVDGRPSDRPRLLAENANWKQVEPAELVKRHAFIPPICFYHAVVERAENDPGILFHQRRRLDDGDLVLLVNTSIESPSSGRIRSLHRGVEQWDLATGGIAPYPSRNEKGRLIADFHLPPCGSLLLFFSNTESGPPAEPAKAKVEEPVAPSGPVEIRRLEPNVLTIDYVDITAGGETRKGLHFYHANQMAFQKNGMERNPWDSAVQFRDELITKKFPPESGFEVAYRFTIGGDVPKPLTIVVERPDLYTIACNGKPVAAEKGAWWLDRAFGRIDLSAAAQSGENVVTLKASPMTIYHEIEPAYVLGEFSLEPAASGFVIGPPKPLFIKQETLHTTDIEGVAWLSAGIGYHRDPKGPGNDGRPWVVFDLGGPTDLAAVDVWNYNEAAIPGRGVKQLEIATSAEAAPESFVKLGVFDLARAPGGSIGAATAPAQRVPLAAKGVRFVRFTVLSNHNGVTFPTEDGSVDSAFAGLSEVRFLRAAADGPQAVAGVKVQAVSSELTSANHDRRAAHLVDSSGMGSGGLGWNQQGSPFYATGVSYAQTFDVPEPKGDYFVSLPSWLGSVARVTVNGRPAGHIYARPFECRVTDYVRPGANRVEVVVVGTLKNTLGPHHAGPMRGSAWPHAFRQGPETGPPAGALYDTIGYGLFQPMVLRGSK